MTKHDTTHGSETSDNHNLTTQRVVPQSKNDIELVRSMTSTLKVCHWI